eukprot:5629957-Pyramimonas_sp.AAC.1
MASLRRINIRASVGGSGAVCDVGRGNLCLEAVLAVRGSLLIHGVGGRGGVELTAGREIGVIDRARPCERIMVERIVGHVRGE